MAFPSYQNTYYPQPSYQNTYYPVPQPDQLAQLRQNQMLPNIPPPQPVPSNPSGTPQNGGMIWVSGKQEADGYLVAPNSALALWDQNNPVIYLRSADSTGKPSTKVYDLVERTDAPAAQTAPEMDMERFVTWDKLDAYIENRMKKPVRATKTKEESENG